MDLASDTNKVEVDFWYTSTLDLGLKLTNEMAAMSTSFGNDHNKQPLFTPRIATYSCVHCPLEFRDKNCVSNGRYCAFDPRYMEAFNLENDEEFKLTGRQVIIQALKEKCFSKIMSEKYKDQGTLFWTFFSYLDKCFAEDSSKGYRRKAHVTDIASCFDWSTVKIKGTEEVSNLNDCVASSWMDMANENGDNRILQEDAKWAKENNMWYHPSVVINKYRFKGDITGE